MRWPPDPEASSAGEDGFAPICAVHLLYETAPPIDRGALLAARSTTSARRAIPTPRARGCPAARGERRSGSYPAMGSWIRQRLNRSRKPAEWW